MSLTVFEYLMCWFFVISLKYRLIILLQTTVLTACQSSRKQTYLFGLPNFMKISIFNMLCIFLFDSACHRISGKRTRSFDGRNPEPVTFIFTIFIFRRVT